MSDIQNSSLPTPDQIRAWEVERDKQMGIAGEATRIATALSRMIDAASALSGGSKEIAHPVTPDGKVLAAESVGKPQSRSLYDAIVKVVTTAQLPLAPRDIRQALLAGPDASLVTSENYLYTAIKRVADKGLIVRGVRGYEPGLLS